MTKIISYEEACNIKHQFHNYKIAEKSIFKEADENGSSKLLLNANGTPYVSILVFDDTVKDIDSTLCGYYISVGDRDITVYLCSEYDGDYRDDLNVCTLSADSSLSQCIGTAKARLSICPVCNKHIDIKDNHRYGFAGRCCSACLPKMKEKFEQPGWYN